MKSSLIIPLVLILSVAAIVFMIVMNRKSSENNLQNVGSNPSMKKVQDETLNPAGDSVASDRTPSSSEADSITLPQEKVFTVEGGNFKFSPNELTVNKGDVVRIIFKNIEGTHDWVSDDFNARTKIIKAGETDEIVFTADKSGNFEYYCSVGKHREMGMVGKLIVN